MLRSGCSALHGVNPNNNNKKKKSSHPSLSHIEQECEENLIQGKIHIQQNRNKGLKNL